MAGWQEDPLFQEHEQREEPWEERTLNLLEDSKIDQEFSECKARKKGRKKHKLKWMRGPMAVPEVILELLDEELRENALRALSDFLLEEVTEFLTRMADDSLNIRAMKRLANVLTLFQSVAANKEIRKKFVDFRYVSACIPNYLIPIILFKSETGMFENIQAIALSVIGILCQGKEPESILWAVESDIVDVCSTVIKTGNELSKVISMHILEYILRDPFGIYFICHPNFCILERLMETWKQLVTLLADDQDFSPRLLFHILRCYVLLSVHSRGILVVSKGLPSEIRSNAFHDVAEEFPVIKSLLHQLLLNVDLTIDMVPKIKSHDIPWGSRVCFTDSP